MRGRTELQVEGLSVSRVPDKLKKEGISLFFVQNSAKNIITFQVESKDCEKVFAILQSPCYNVSKRKSVGLSYLTEKLHAYAGLLAGLVFFLVLIIGLQTRVLAVRVVGSGAYYEPEVVAKLGEKGVKQFSSMPKDTAALYAELLSLPRVSFCEIKKSGGILTVEIQVSDENVQLDSKPLLSPVSGTIEELVVIRGTAYRAVGDLVSAGDVLVNNVALYGEEEKKVVVIARATVCYPVQAEYAGSEEEALSGAFLEYGTLSDVVTEVRDGKVYVSGIAHANISLNLQ